MRYKMKGQFLFLWLLVCLVPLVASKGSKNSLNVQLKHFNEADADSDGQVDLNEVNTFIVSNTLIDRPMLKRVLLPEP